MVPVDSVGVSRDPTYSGVLGRLRKGFAYGTITLCGPTFQMVLLPRTIFPCEILQPRRGDPRGLGCFAFARRYLRNRFFFLLLRLLRCFSSPRSIGNPGIIACLSTPPGISQTSTPILLMPRHPPCALSSLATFIQCSHVCTAGLRSRERAWQMLLLIRSAKG